MTLHPILLNFLIYEENFIFFFYQCSVRFSLFVECELALAIYSLLMSKIHGFQSITSEKSLDSASQKQYFYFVKEKCFFLAFYLCLVTKLCLGRWRRHRWRSWCCLPPSFLMSACPMPSRRWRSAASPQEAWTRSCTSLPCATPTWTESYCLLKVESRKKTRH